MQVLVCYMHISLTPPSFFPVHQRSIPSAESTNGLKIALVRARLLVAFPPHSHLKEAYEHCPSCNIHLRYSFHTTVMDISSTTGTCPLTPFDRALEAYLAGLPKDKKKFKFVDLCRGSGEVTPQEINDFIQSEVSKRTLSGPAKRLFNRLINAVKDFSGVIDQIGKLLGH